MKHLLITTIAAVLLVGCVNLQSPDISIHQAAWTGNINVVKQYLAAGANVNAKGENGWTPLHMAALSGHKEIAELLIAKAANKNAEVGDENTPLHYAAFNGHKEIVELLIAAGVDVNAKNNGDLTPLDLAVRSDFEWKDREAMAQLLHKHGGKRGAELK